MFLETKEKEKNITFQMVHLEKVCIFIDLIVMIYFMKVSGG